MLSSSYNPIDTLYPCPSPDLQQVVDKHLSALAKQHVETRFVKVHAEKAPFLTEKLRIVVLPTLAIVKNAKVEDYVVSETTLLLLVIP